MIQGKLGQEGHQVQRTSQIFCANSLNVEKRREWPNRTKTKSHISKYDFFFLSLLWLKHVLLLFDLLIPPKPFKLCKRKWPYYAMIQKICLLLSSTYFVGSAYELSLLSSPVLEPGAHGSRPASVKRLSVRDAEKSFPAGANAHCYYLIEKALR